MTELARCADSDLGLENFRGEPRRVAADLATRHLCIAGSAEENIVAMVNSRIHETADGLVVSNPGVLGGKPVFRGTRQPVSALFEYLADGLPLEYFLESLPSVTREQAVGVIRYGQRRIEDELAA